MLRFPTLQTGAVAQYPAARVRDHRTRVVEYTDGTEQRFAEMGAAQNRWHLRLSNLSEDEAVAMARFFTAARGRSGTFSFTDPFTGIEHSDCTLAEDGNRVVFTGEGQATAEVTIRRLD